MATGGTPPPTSGDGGLQPPPAPVSSAQSTTATTIAADVSSIPTSAGGISVNNVSGSQPAFVTDPTSSVGTFSATSNVSHPNIMGAHSNLVGGNAMASLMGASRMTSQVLPGSVIGGGGGGFAVPGQNEPVRDPQSLFSTPPPSFSMNSLLAALPSSTPDQIRQLQGILTQFSHLSVSNQHQAFRDAVTPPYTPVKYSVDQLNSVVQQLVLDQQNLLTSRKEEEIRIRVSQFTNPLSKRAVEGLLRLGDAVERLFKVISVGGKVLVADTNNFAHVNLIISLVVSGLQEMRDRVKTDLNKFDVSLESPLGWKIVSDMEKLEGQCGTISRAELRAQEKVFLQHEQMLASTRKAANTTKSQGAGNNSNNGKKGGKGKNKNKKKKSAAEKALELKDGGGVSKPKRGACHRCGGPHFVRNCPKPLVTDEAS